MLILAPGPDNGPAEEWDKIDGEQDEVFRTTASGSSSEMLQRLLVVSGHDAGSLRIQSPTLSSQDAGQEDPAPSREKQRQSQGKGDRDSGSISMT